MKEATCQVLGGRRLPRPTSMYTTLTPPLKTGESGFNVQHECPIGLFANDVIIIGSVRADWPAPFSVTIGNPRADKLGRNGFDVSYCVVQLTEKDVSGQRLCIALSIITVQVCRPTILHFQRRSECRGKKRSRTKSLFMIISHNCQSYVCRRQPLLLI